MAKITRNVRITVVIDKYSAFVGYLTKLYQPKTLYTAL